MVATLLCGKPVPVHCSPPPGITWEDGIDGYAMWPPNRIYLRRCLATVRLKQEPIVAFSHELIHIQHHNWPHSKVYALDNWYSRIVIRKIKYVEANYKPLGQSS